MRYLGEQSSAAEEVLADATKYLPNGAKTVAGWKSYLDVSALVGKPAAAIDVNYWLTTGEAPQSKTFDPKGNVTLIEFTSHY
jgi:hypothetical protein